MPSSYDACGNCRRYRLGISYIVAKLWCLKGSKEIEDLADAIAWDLQEILEGKSARDGAELP